MQFFPQISNMLPVCRYHYKDEVYKDVSALFPPRPLRATGREGREEEAEGVVAPGASTCVGGGVLGRCYGGV